MKRFTTILLTFLCLGVWTNKIWGQCSPVGCSGLPMPALSAPDACINCIPAILDGYSGSTSSTPNSTTVPTVFCGTVENNQWFAFAAPQADVTISFQVSNCANPTSGGIQAEIYCTTDCTNNWTSVSNCWSPGMESNGSVTATGLTVGDIYYLMIDGFAGDVCDFTMTITNPPGGGGLGILEPPTGIAGDSDVCFPSSTFSTYLLPPGASCASSLIWSIQPPNMGAIVSDPTASSILVQWTQAGFAQVCVQASNTCSTSAPGCFPVNVQSIPPGTETADLCLGGITICAGQVFNVPGVFPVILQTSLGCDSLVNCIINPIVPPVNNIGQLEFCAPHVEEVCGTFHSTSGIFTDVCVGGSWTGCDSTVIVDLAIMDAEAVVEDPGTLSCDTTNQEITLDASNSIFTIAPGSTLEFEWTGPSFCGPTDDVFACVDEPGNYCFTVTVARNMVTCSNTFCVDVLADTDVPQSPDLSGPIEVCDGALEEYIVSPVGTPVPTFYEWTTPNNEPFTINGTTIEVDWTGSVGGDLCVTANNDCGPSDSLTCINVVVSLGPDDPVVVGDTIVCDGDIETYVIENPDTSATYTWTVPTGASFTNNGDTIIVDYNGASSGDICVEGENDCGLSAQFCLTIALDDVPGDPTISSGSTQLCGGTMETYCVDPVTGATSYTWTTPQGTFPGSTDCIMVDWTGQSSGQVCVTADNDCGPSGQVCVDVIVDENPTATLSGGDSYCEGSGNTVDLTIDLTGTAPWTFTYNDGTNDFMVTTSDNPYILSVGTAGTYTLVDLNDATACAGVVNGQAIVTEDEAPTAMLTGSGAICAGSTDTVALMVTLTGAPNWTVDWSIDGNAQAALSITSSPFTLQISESQAGDIELTGVVDGNGCDGTASGLVNVNVNDAPEVSGISAVCDGTNTNFTVEFTITGGDPASYSVTPNTGTLDGATGIFTSDPITSGLGYSFVVTDINDCDPVTVSQMAVICNCDTEVGTMDQTEIRECGDGPVTADYDDTNQMFDADDILVFILHEGNGLSIVNPIATNDTEPTFGYTDPPMTYGTTYYISAVVGSDDGNGMVDLNDPCLAVAQGTPVTFNEIPSATLSGSTAICEGDGADLFVDFTGPGPWTIFYTDDMGQQMLTGITTNPFTLTVNPATTTLITLDSMQNVDCPGPVSGFADVTVNTAVEVTNLVETCNSTATGYTVTFQISGGDPSSYVVTPLGSGTIDMSGLFTSNEIPDTDGYSFTVDDANSCNPVTVSATMVDCECTTAVGTMDLNAFDECGDGPVLAIYDAMNENLDGDDVITYILHEGSGTTIINEIARNALEPSFSYMAPPMSYGTTYYISAVVGNNDGNGSVDLTDPCLSIAAGTPVTFFEVPSADLSGDPAICLGDCATLSIALTGDAPWSVTVNNGTSDVVITDINSSPFNYDVCPTSNTNYTLVAVMDENCPGGIAGAASVTVNEAPVITNVNETINGTNTAFTVSFEISGGDPASYTVTPPNGTISAMAPYIFTSNEIPCGSGYSFSLDDANACGPNAISNPMVECQCISQAGDMEATLIEECGNGPAMATYNPINEALDGNDVLCYMLHSGDSIPISTNDEPSFNFSPITMNYGQTYFICAVAGDDNGNGCVNFNDPCLSIGGCAEVVYYEIPSATLTGGADICDGDDASLEVTFTGVGPWSFTYTSSTGGDVTVTDITDNPYTLVVNPSITTTYSMLGVADFNCPGNGNGVAVVNVSSAPFITPPTPICNATNTGYVVTFQINGGDPLSYSITPATGTIDAGGVFTSDEIPNGDAYQFFIDDANGCGPVEASGDHFCECTTWSGTIFPLSDIDACGDEVINVGHDGNEILDGDDVLNYFIHTGDNVPLMISTDGNFVFDDAAVDYEVNYVLCAVAGNNDGNGTVDFNDPCLSITDICRQITFHEIPTATISGDQAICENTDATITIDFTGTGPWDVTYNSTAFGMVTETGITDNPLILSLDINDSEVLTLVDVATAFCAGTVSGSADVQVTNAPDFDLSTLTYDCNPANFTYTVSVAIVGGDQATYNVTGASGTIAGNIFTSDQIAGLTPFQLFVDDQFACGPNELSDVSPIPTGTITGESTICEGDQTPVVITLSGVGPYDVEYIDENGMTQNVSTGGPTVDLMVSPSTTSTVTLVSVTNPTTGCGNAPNESITITVNPQANAGVPNEPFEACRGEANAVNLFDLLSGEDAGGQWQNSTGSVVSSTFNTGPQNAGTFVFTYVAPGMAPCPDATSQVEVIIHELPIADAGNPDELTCDNTMATIGGNSSTGPEFTYSWSAAFPFPGDSTQATVEVSLPGDYTLVVTNTETGCTNSDVVTVQQNAETPVVNPLVNDVRCFGDNDGFITIESVTGGVGPYMYSFNGGPFSDQTTWTDLGPGSYTIVVEDSKGCQQELTFNILEPDELNVEIVGDFEGDEHTINLGDSLFLQLEVSVPFGALDAVQWFPPELFECDTCQQSWTYPLLQTNFSVTIEDDGCTAQDDLTVFVKKNRPVYVPNVFSPDAGGHPDNDIFRIFAGPQVARVKSFLVFNRWGETVFEVLDFDPKDPSTINIGWDGTFKGEPMGPGVFVWFAEIEFIDGEVEIYEGDVTLMR